MKTFTCFHVQSTIVKIVLQGEVQLQLLYCDRHKGWQLTATWMIPWKETDILFGHSQAQLRIPGEFSFNNRAPEFLCSIWSHAHEKKQKVMRKQKQPPHQNVHTKRLSPLLLCSYSWILKQVNTVKSIHLNMSCVFSQTCPSFWILLWELCSPRQSREWSHPQQRHTLLL